MRASNLTNRRRFLQATAAASLAPFISRASAAELLSENEHFQYRLAPPDGPYIDSQRGNQAFAFQDGHLLYSDDNSHSFDKRAAFPDAKNILWSVILKNGNILFSTQAKLFLSTDQLKSYREITVKRPDGSDYIPHTPIDPEKPGWYFHALNGVHTWEVNGKEILVWGNYCNVLGGAVPANIFYSVDGGETVKLAYSFGHNPSFQQEGAKPEDFLGDPDNPIICRHIHDVAYNPAENAFYACTGDIDRGRNSSKHEVHWLRGTYDWAADKWDWQVLKSVNSNSRYKSGGFNFRDGRMYWASDANGAADEHGKYDRGIFYCNPAEYADESKHVKLFDAPFESANMIIQDDFIIAAYYAPASDKATGFMLSPDFGKTWVEYDLAEFGERSPVRFHPKNDEGWIRIDLRKGWIERAEVLFIKPKM